MYQKKDRFVFIDEVDESELVEVNIGRDFNTLQELKDYAIEVVKSKVRQTMSKLSEESDFSSHDAELDLQTRARYFLCSDEYFKVKGSVLGQYVEYRESIFNFDYV